MVAVIKSGPMILVNKQTVRISLISLSFLFVANQETTIRKSKKDRTDKTAVSETNSKESGEMKMNLCMRIP
jgi:hypothetical protein